MIIKEKVLVRGYTAVPVSAQATLLAFGVTDGDPVLWIDEPNMDHRSDAIEVATLFTGDDAPESKVYFGTTQNNGIVIHAYVYRYTPAVVRARFP